MISHNCHYCISGQHALFSSLTLAHLLSAQSRIVCIHKETCLFCNIILFFVNMKAQQMKLSSSRSAMLFHKKCLLINDCLDYILWCRFIRNFNLVPIWFLHNGKHAKHFKSAIPGHSVNTPFLCISGSIRDVYIFCGFMKLGRICFEHVNFFL